MGNKLIFSIGFVLGTIGGALTSGFYLKKKYEHYMQDEIESIKESYRRKNGGVVNNVSNEKLVDEEVKSEILSEKELEKQYYKEFIKQNGYSVEEETNPDMIVISPDEFGDLAYVGEYDVYEYTYHGDGSISNEDHERVDDLFSDEILDRFGEFEEDALHILDDAHNCLYEILRDEQSFVEV